ncbi:GTPase ObgE [bacterium]|nr:GTPase ObgE [bacterium]
MPTSNFIDVATIWLHAGKGGDGAVSFHREKFVAAGGPDGGDGGRGGSIVFQADPNLSTLMDFRYKRKYTAPDGENGSGARRKGRDGEDLVIRVPRGTVLKEADSGLVVADLSTDEPVVVARGGRGGWGNARFATPTRQIPRFAKPGLPGEDLHLTLELKVIADVGLIGFPNVGKSTLISMISAAKPKIANYHFTTLTPVLGVVRVGPEQSFVCADIPGLIEGAADGVGLGHDFLRHVERCRLLLHVVDVSGSEGRDPRQDFEQINHELEGFSAELAGRPQIVLGNKCDIATPEQIEDFRSFIEEKGLTFLPISAATRQGMDALPALVYQRLRDLPPVKVFEAEYVRPDRTAEPTRPFTVEKTGDHEFTVDAPWLERILAGTNVEDYESLQYFQTQLGDSGILDELVRQNVEENDTIKIGEYEFDYVY